VLCSDRLFQQYVVDACAKMEHQRLNYVRYCGLIRTDAAADAVLANDGYRAGRRLRNFMLIVCNKPIEHDEYRFCFLCFDLTFLRDKSVWKLLFTILD